MKNKTIGLIAAISFSLQPLGALTAPADSTGAGSVININAAVSGYNAGTVTHPVELTLASGCYEVQDAYRRNSGALYGSFNYHLGAANDWAWQYRVLSVETGAPLLYAAAPNNESPATKYQSETAATLAGLTLSPTTFCLDAKTNVGFAVDDNFLPDNTGGVSVLVSQSIPGNALTIAAPASTIFDGGEISGWEGYTPGDGHPIFYSTFDGKSDSDIRQLPGVETTTAPAFAAIGGTLYVATTPPNSEDKLVIHSSTGSVPPLCVGNLCARTKATPALATDGSTLYAAWTELDGTVRSAALVEHSWMIDAVPRAHTSATTGPTLVVFHNSLYLAWTSTSGESVAVTMRSLPVMHHSWATEPKLVSAHTTVAPTLGVLAKSDSSQVLTLGWTTSESTLDFAEYDSKTSEWSRAQPPLVLPPAPITVLPASFGSGTIHNPDGTHTVYNFLNYAGLIPQGSPNGNSSTSNDTGPPHRGNNQTACQPGGQSVGGCPHQ